MNKNYTYIIILLLLWYWYNSKESKVIGNDPNCWRWADGSSFVDGFNTPSLTGDDPYLLGSWKMYYYCCDDFSVCAKTDPPNCAYNIGFYWIANDNDALKVLQPPPIFSDGYNYGIIGQPKSNITNNQMYSFMNKRILDLMIQTGEIPANSNYRSGYHASDTTGDGVFDSFIRPKPIHLALYYNIGKSSATIQYIDNVINHNFLVSGIRNISNYSGATPTFTELNRVKIRFSYLDVNGDEQMYIENFYPDITEVCGSAGENITLGGS